MTVDVQNEQVEKEKAGDKAEQAESHQQSSQMPQPKAFPTARPSQVPDPNSKNQQKKLKRKLEWEEGRESRKIQRREKTKAAKARKREAKQAEGEWMSLSTGADGAGYGRSSTNPQTADGKNGSSKSHPVQVPVTIIVDCQFDDYMTEPERISLGSQLTRCYADNRKAKFRAHLAVSSFGGPLKERFEGILGGVYKNWNGVRFREGDWTKVAQEAREWMTDGRRGGRVRGALAKKESNSTKDEDEEVAGEDDVVKPVDDDGEVDDPASQDQVEQQATPQTDQQASLHEAPIEHNPDQEATPSDTIQAKPRQPKKEDEIVYLTSDSPNTLSELSPWSTYVIGGIVDKNRHKGICYRLASDAAAAQPSLRIQTARLPIGEFLDMSSRKVLTTNHVCEIMLRWLELGDWGAAFMAVIPKRKKGELRAGGQPGGAAGSDDEDDADEPGDKSAQPSEWG